MCEVAIRPYERGDREAVFRIAADTAFFGEPVEIYLDDRTLFCDAFYRYYTDLEPGHGWVACADGVVVGFLMGCVDTSMQRRLWVKEILPGIALRMLKGQYKVGTRTWRHVGRLAWAALHARPRVDTAKYPAHLHINVQAEWRGRGLGRFLLEAFLIQLRELGVTGVHLKTTSLNATAGRLYESLGFRAVDIRPSFQWAGLVPGAVFNVAYALDLRAR